MKRTGSAEGRRGRRTGPTHRSRDIHFHFIFLPRALSETEEEKRSEGGGIGKNFRPFPPKRGERLRIVRRIARGIRDIRDFAREREREKERAMKTRMRARARVAFLRLSSRATVCGIG